MEYITENIPAILTFLAGIGAWGYERTKRKQELKASETSNNKSIMDLYQEALDDLKQRYDLKFNELELDITVLQDNLKESELRYDKLKKEFTTYKRNHK